MEVKRVNKRQGTTFIAKSAPKEWKALYDDVSANLSSSEPEVVKSDKIFSVDHLCKQKKKYLNQISSREQTKESYLIADPRQSVDIRWDFGMLSKVF